MRRSQPGAGVPAPVPGAPPQLAVEGTGRPELDRAGAAQDHGPAALVPAVDHAGPALRQRQQADLGAGLSATDPPFALLQFQICVSHLVFSLVVYLIEVEVEALRAMCLWSSPMSHCFLFSCRGVLESVFGDHIFSGLEGFHLCVLVIYLFKIPQKGKNKLIGEGVGVHGRAPMPLLKRFNQVSAVQLIAWALSSTVQSAAVVLSPNFLCATCDVTLAAAVARLSRLALP